MVAALGVVNISINSALVSLADEHERGGLMGVMDAVESVSGSGGPVLGGLLSQVWTEAPLVSVVGIYALLFVVI